MWNDGITAAKALFLIMHILHLLWHLGIKMQEHQFHEDRKKKTLRTTYVILCYDW